MRLDLINKFANHWGQQLPLTLSTARPPSPSDVSTMLRNVFANPVIPHGAFFGLAALIVTSLVDKRYFVTKPLPLMTWTQGSIALFTPILDLIYAHRNGASPGETVTRSFLHIGLGTFVSLTLSDYVCPKESLERKPPIFPYDLYFIMASTTALWNLLYAGYLTFFSH